MKTDAILAGEHNLTTVLLKHDVNIDCLLKACQNVDWRNSSHWNCNKMAHPSRSGTYFGTSINPLEVKFHKPNWAGTSPVSPTELKLNVQWDDQSLHRGGTAANHTSGTCGKSQEECSLSPRPGLLLGLFYRTVQVLRLILMSPSRTKPFRTVTHSSFVGMGVRAHLIRVDLNVKE